MAPVIWNKDVPLIEIDLFRYRKLNLNHHYSAAYVQWSPDNRMLSVNMMDRVSIYELNIDSSHQKLTFFNQPLGKSLRLRYGELRPPDVCHDVGQLLPNSNHWDRKSFLMKAPRNPQRFMAFEFGPLQPDKSFHLAAALTDHDHLCIYLNRVPLQWPHRFDVSKFFAQEIWKRTPPPETPKKDSYKDYFGILAKVRITAFAWHPLVQYQNEKRNEISYRMFLATRDGSIHLIELMLDSNGEFQMKILNTWQNSGLEKIILLKVIDPILLIHSNDGRLTGCDMNLSLEEIPIWTKKDQRPCFNLASHRGSNSLIQILFSKYQSLVVAKLDVGGQQLRLHSVKEIAVVPEVAPQSFVRERFEDIFAVFNLNSHYCLTTMSDDIWAFQLTTSKPTTEAKVDAGDTPEVVLLRNINIPSFQTDNENQHYCCVATSGSHALVAILSRPCRFSSAFAHFNSDNVRLSLSTFMDLPAVAPAFVRQILAPGANLADFLYLFRCCLIRRDCLVEHVQPMVDFLLERSPVWLTEHQDDRKSVLNMKFIRNAARFCLLAEKYLQEDQKPQLRLLVERINYMIARHWFCAVIRFNLEEPWEKWMKLEHIVSLYNMMMAKLIVPVDEQMAAKIESIAKSAAKDCPYPSIRAGQTLAPNSELAPQLNCCPFSCRCPINDPAAVAYQQQQNQYIGVVRHPLDIDSNTLLVLDPQFDQIEICSWCFESKMARYGLWIDPRHAPFQPIARSETDNTHDTLIHCLFCL